MSTARMRRIASDFEEVKKNFNGHKNIVVEPIGGDPPEKYRVTYYVNGIYLLQDGRVETLGRHIVEITLHSEYPRYKPLCKILTPIWHPNFRGDQICIGDIWGAGESLSDIIINIGDMIQYKSWNAYSPLSAEAAKWAILNKHLFPVGNIDLYSGEEETAGSEIEIDIGEEEEASKPSFDMPSEISETENQAAASEVIGIAEMPPAVSETIQVEETIPASEEEKGSSENDFEITAEELSGIQFVPTAQRMQSVSQGMMAKKKRINFKTIFMKGILYGLIGGIVGWLISEISKVDSATILGWMGYTPEKLLSDYYKGLLSESQVESLIMNTARLDSAIFSGIIGGFIGAVMGLGEGIYYGSRQKAIKYTFAGLGIAMGIGLVGGYLAQIMYSNMLINADENTSLIYLSFSRAISWALVGLGVGAAVGLIKPSTRRILNCIIGGLVGGFIGGFIFNYIFKTVTTGETDSGMVPRAIGVIIMGILIGLGIGLLEQFAKSAWLKVIRGEFEGKEYLVFQGITSIGNTGKNTIVLFKDRLVAPFHCDIIQEGNKYIIVDKGSPMGTIVNGMRITRHVLRQGDAIALGNSVLIFNTK